jgi:hypothetical protein
MMARRSRKGFESKPRPFAAGPESEPPAKPRYAASVCRSCGEKCHVSPREFRRASRPRFPACGGSLDYTGVL